MTTWLLGGGREGAGSQMSEIWLPGPGHSAFVLSPARLKLCNHLSQPMIFDDDFLLPDHREHAPAEVFIACLCKVSCAQGIMNPVGVRIQAIPPLLSAFLCDLLPKKVRKPLKTGVATSYIVRAEAISLFYVTNFCIKSTAFITSGAMKQRIRP